MRERMIMSALCLVAAVASTACSARGPAFQRLDIPSGKGVIYAYRPNTMVGAAIQPTVNCGSTGVSLPPGGYHPFVVDPGSVTCSAKTESRAEVLVDVRANEDSYVRETIGVGFFVGRPHLQVVDKEKGQQEIKDCKLQ